MELLGDVGQMEARFGPFGDRVNLDARWLHGLCQRAIDLEFFWAHLMGQVEAHSNSVGDSVNLNTRSWFTSKM
jgi:hypothetical protein